MAIRATISTPDISLLSWYYHLTYQIKVEFIRFITIGIEVLP